MRLALIALAVCWFCRTPGFGQTYDLLLKGGHVLDPANGVDDVRDVAIAGGKIAAISANIPESRAKAVRNVDGHYVAPGLIDLHTHVYLKGRSSTVQADQSVLPHGVTTIVDAGVSGWKTFDDFKATVIDRSRVRILALLNIVSTGMHDDQTLEFKVEDMDPKAAAEKATKHPETIVGIKSAHFGPPGWIAIERAVEAGRLANLPVMLDSNVYSNSGRDTRTKVLEKMRPGDLHTHMYNDHQMEVLDRFTDKVQPWMWEARKRGVLFDLGHGAGGFLWPIAKSAMAQGFPPDTISTDLHPQSILTLEVSMTNAISKLMALGMTLPDAVQRATVNPAKAIRRYPEIGTLGVGRTADVAVLRLQTGVFALIDSRQRKLTATQNVEAVMTLRAGEIVYDHPLPAQTGPTDVYDLLLKGGHVIDPANRRDGKFDIAIRGGKIARVAGHIRADHARLVADVSDFYVTPGLIDSRIKANFLADSDAVQPDQFCLPHGVTTAVDPAADREAIRRSRTRIIAAGAGKIPADALSTGATRARVSGGDISMTAVLWQQLRSGATFAELIRRATVVPAKALTVKGLGSLEEGSPADIAAFEVGPEGITAVLTLRNGQPVWDSRGLTMRDWAQSGGYTNFK